MDEFIGALFGHSFTKRMRDVIVSELRRVSSKNRFSSVDVSLYAPEYFEIDRLFKQIFVEMDNTYLVSDLIRQINSVLKDQKIHVAVFMSGSNDLTDRSKCPIQTAVNLFEIGQYTIHGFDVKSVVFVQAIRRSKCRGMSPDEFSLRLQQFNRKLVELCQNPDSCSRVIAVKGLWRNPDQSVKGVSEFAEDGIHPGSFPNKRGTDVDSDSFKKLKYTIKRSFSAGIGIWKARQR